MFTFSYSYINLNILEKNMSSDFWTYSFEDLEIFGHFFVRFINVFYSEYSGTYDACIGSVPNRDMQTPPPLRSGHNYMKDAHSAE